MRHPILSEDVNRNEAFETEICGLFLRPKVSPPLLGRIKEHREVSLFLNFSVSGKCDRRRIDPWCYVTATHWAMASICFLALRTLRIHPFFGASCLGTGRNVAAGASCVDDYELPLVYFLICGVYSDCR